MCGITFILSKTRQNIINELFESLFMIQNRGYDSMGICYYDNSANLFKIEKKASTYSADCFNLLKEKFINEYFKESHMALGHTRWATHGGKTDANAHPHHSIYGNIILVHNGIINNFDIIKSKLIDKGYNSFYSETDSEIIANLIDYYLFVYTDIKKAIKRATEELEGTWALIIIYTKDPDNVYITRHGSPLLLGSNSKYTICTSEINGFAGQMNNYIVLNNKDIIKVNIEKYESLNVSDNTNSQSQYLEKTINKEDIVKSPAPYPFWMIKEIMEQPETIEKAFNHGGRILHNQIRLGGLDRIREISKNIEFVLIIGCGTSFNAGLIGESYFNTNNSNNFTAISCVNACEFCEKNIPKIPDKQKILCIFLSQSGETIDVYNCLKVCKEQGCITMGIINRVDSLIAREVDCGVYLNAGLEISVASTKSFTSMLIVLSLVEMWFSQNNISNSKKIDNLRFLQNTIIQLLYDFKFLKAIDFTKDFIIEQKINNIFILGKSKLFPVACEGSLKIKEVCYIHSEGFSASALKHGPFALLDKTNLTFLLIDYTDTTNYPNLKSTFYEISGRETNIIVITNSYTVIEELKLKEEQYILLYKLDCYNEIIFTITLQKLAYEISIGKGINPDKPRNLAKVVTVE
jgi:glutamine---fructose-6-phosphate transaminase (isomerizing)